LKQSHEMIKNYIWNQTTKSPSSSKQHKVETTRHNAILLHPLTRSPHQLIC